MLAQYHQQHQGSEDPEVVLILSCVQKLKPSRTLGGFLGTEAFLCPPFLAASMTFLEFQRADSNCC